jgi:hypothetical protein
VREYFFLALPTARKEPLHRVAQCGITPVNIAAVHESEFDVVDGARSRQRGTLGLSLSTNHIRERPMQVTTIGLDIAKNVFQILWGGG